MRFYSGLDGNGGPDHSLKGRSGSLEHAAAKARGYKLWPNSRLSNAAAADLSRAAGFAAGAGAGEAGAREHDSGQELDPWEAPYEGANDPDWGVIPREWRCR